VSENPDGDEDNTDTDIGCGTVFACRVGTEGGNVIVVGLENFFIHDGSDAAEADGAWGAGAGTAIGFENFVIHAGSEE
jgi:hypothetical protein